MSGRYVLISGSNDQQGGLTIDQGHTATQASGDPFMCEDKDEGDGGSMQGAVKTLTWLGPGTREWTNLKRSSGAET